jgi:hypothetical protein
MNLHLIKTILLVRLIVFCFWEFYAAVIAAPWQHFGNYKRCADR